MFMRRRPLLRAAAVGGTAYVAGRHMANKANEQAEYEAQQDQRISDLEAQQQGPADRQQAPPPPAAAPAAAPAAPSIYDQISQLSTLHEQGALTDDEFSAAKAKLLGT